MIRYIKNKIFCASLLAIAGCADSSYTDIDHEVDSQQGTYVSLRLYRPGDENPSSRAPQGGVYGDGFEPANQWSPYLKGIDYDYRVQDLCLFLIDTNGRSVEDYLNDEESRNKQFFGAYYINESHLLKPTDEYNDGHDEHPIDKRYVAKINVGEVMIEPLFHRIIVVANVGDIASQCKTVGDLLTKVATHGHTPGTDGSIYVNCESSDYITASTNHPSHFAMGLYEEPSMIMKHAGTKEDPHTATVTLERLSARVDFRLTQHPSERSQRKDAFAPIPYDVKGSENTVLSRNWITHVRMVNAAVLPSYILRRSASNAAGAGLHYLGFEQANSDNVTTNYILDPYTTNKATIPTEYFGGTKLANAMARPFMPEERVVSREAYRPLMDFCVGLQSAMQFDKESQYDQYFIVGYPQENILKREQMTKEYATGLLYRTVYEPAMVWKLNDEKDGIVSETVELTRDVLSNGTVPEGGYKSSHYGKTFWMIERLVPNPTEADRVYFVADASGDQEGEGADEKAGTTTDEGKEKIKRAAELYIAAHSETGWTQPIEYVGGVAYNYYWIRHSNSQGTGHPFSPMEYSIVRNNIYSIGITSFSGPGAPSTDPSMDNPDRIQPITYVHKWHPYTVDEIPM